MSKRIFISAGEASGEMYGAQLMDSLRRAAPSSIDFFGLGGTRMLEAGFDAAVNSADVAVVGLAEVIKHLPMIYARFRALLREIDRRKPDVAVLIDFPDFNFRLARQLHRRGVPVVYFVSPQLWAWRKGRIKQVQKYVNKMLVIFPFEEKYYRDRGVDAEYVGHPLADASPSTLDRHPYAREYGLDPSRQWIALLPGSRKQEVERHLPVMLQAAGLLGDRFEYLLPVASTLNHDWMTRQIERSSPAVRSVHLVPDSRPALAHARVSIIASGTATVEAALAGNPFVVVYKLSPLTWALGRQFVKLDNFAMVNLVAGKTVVPELIQNDFTPGSVVATVRLLLPHGPTREQMITELAEVKKKLHLTSSEEFAMDRAARAVLQAAGLQ